MKPRVFVSSVIEEFQEYREAARKGIVLVGGEPILVEDYPSLTVSPRNACLDGIASSDVFICVIGARGGWVAPSGKLVVEEEYEEALRRKLHIFVFIQKIKHDEQADEFVKKMSDYIDGIFRQTFYTPAELERAVEKALIPVFVHQKKPRVDIDMINEQLQESYKIQGETSVRFILMPERKDEFIDPIALESLELKNQILQIGHSPGVGLFSYEWPKNTEVGVNSIVILQSEEGRCRPFVDEVRLELNTEGLTIIDTNVSNCAARDRLQEMLCSMVIIEGDIVSKLNRCFAFARNLFEIKDPFKRYNRFLYNVALSEIGHRILMSKPPQGSSTYSMGNQSDKVVIVFDKPRIITRVGFIDYEKEIETILVVLRRRLKSRY
jgi:organic radical activating enzyme